MELKYDCIYFRGDKPCIRKRICDGCDEYTPQGKRILIIKLAAPGDVLRTTPLLCGLKRIYPVSHITWITDNGAYDLLKSNPLINRLLIHKWESLIPLFAEEFDLLICLDKEHRAAALTNLINANRKVGIGLTQYGSIYPVNEECEYYFSLGISDELKFKLNKKTYQELIFDVCGIKYQLDGYLLEIPEEDKDFADSLMQKSGITESDIVIGISTGAGPVFANKSWRVEKYIELINRLLANQAFKILLLGGPLEVEKNSQILARFGKRILDAGCYNTITQFCGIVSRCKLMVCSDTLPMHIGIGMGVLMVVMFGPTCAQEVELYSRGMKLVSSMECAPCYKSNCDKEPNCMDHIKIEDVYAAIMALLKKCGI